MRENKQVSDTVQCL